MTDFARVPCVLMRGGTSKGLVLKQSHLPQDPVKRDQVILRLFGSPDERQIDGLGGGSPLTSKLGIVGPSSYPNVDVNYTFGQVSLQDRSVDYKPTCGNMSAAVGLYSVEEGFVPIQEPVTTVRIYNTNIDKMIEVDVPVKNGKIHYKGDFSIAGVPGTSSRVTVNFLDSGGSITGELLPTGNVKDKVTIEDGRTFDVSVIDCANLIVYVNAEQLGISGSEMGEHFKQEPLLSTLEAIRVEIGVRIGMFTDKSQVSPVSHAIPKIAVIARPQTYTSSTGETVSEQEIDIVGRYVAMGQLHQAFAVSGGIAVATGAKIPGTVLHDIVGNNEKGDLNLGHPSGIINVEVKVEENEGNYTVTRAAIGRTARRLMEGYGYVEEELLK